MSKWEHLLYYKLICYNSILQCKGGDVRGREKEIEPKTDNWGGMCSSVCLS